MNEDQVKFYLVVALALVIRIFSAPFESMKAHIVLVVTSVGCVVIFTDPVAFLLGITNEGGLKNAVAALITMTSMGLVKWLLAFVENIPTSPSAILKLFKEWRSGK